MNLTGKRPDESEFETAALDIIWSFQGETTRNDPTIRNCVKILDSAGQIYNQTGKSGFGPYGSIMHESLEIIRDRVKDLTNREFGSNFRNAIWDQYNEHYPKPADPAQSLTDWRQGKDKKPGVDYTQSPG